MFSKYFRLRKILFYILLVAPMVFYMSSLIFTAIQSNRGPYSFFRQATGSEGVVENLKEQLEIMVKDKKNLFEIIKFLNEVGLKCKVTKFSEMHKSIRDLATINHGNSLYNSTSCFYYTGLLGASISTHIYSDENGNVIWIHTSYYDPLTS